MQENTGTTRITQRVRQGLDTGAEWVAERKRPLDVVTEKTLKLNGISHESAARMVRQQAEFFEGTVDAAARRLKTASEADSIRSLIDGQIKMFPETRDRIVDDVRKTFEILSDTREDLGQLIRETLSDLRADTGMHSIDDVTDKVSSTAKDVSQKAKDLGEKAKGKAKDLSKKAGESAS